MVRMKVFCLCATIMDGNFGIFSIAFGVSKSENEESWGWFLYVWAEHIGNLFEIIWLCFPYYLFRVLFVKSSYTKNLQLMESRSLNVYERSLKRSSKCLEKCVAICCHMILCESCDSKRLSKVSRLSSRYVIG